VTDLSPTRAALLELQDERHAMREGYVFLDEKCLLLAGEMLRQLGRHAVLERGLRAAHAAALHALRAALARHGLDGLQVQIATELGQAPLRRTASALMGVQLLQAEWGAATGAAVPPDEPAPAPSPELRACRRVFADLIAAAAPLAAVVGNLERLSQEYRRSVRRARALQDVLLPELDRDIAEIQTRIDELEQQDAIWMRRSAAAPGAESR
jgi:V/A-type H+-transporting ATPase subunit D